MPVNYVKLQEQLKTVGQNARAQMAELEEKLTLCRSLLQQHDKDLIKLQQLVEEAVAKNKGLRCAVPLEESLTTHLSSTAKGSPCTILAADGSQINPDPHDSVLFGLINLGFFILRPGSGEVPREQTYTHLLFGEDVQTPSGLASEDLIALLRDVGERKVLAEIAVGLPAPVLTLTDGPLELYHEPRQEFRGEFDSYLAALDDLAVNNIITAGYISRPRADLLVNLLALLHHSAGESGTGRPFGGVTDTHLLETLLAPGERSAIFRLQSSSSKDYAGRKALHFFYLNAGKDGKPAFARVEIPLWVVETPGAVDLLQSVLLEQARMTGETPYPYPLIRAHEIAVVKLTDREEVTRMLQNELLKQGLTPGRKSEKQIQKDDVGKKRAR